MFLYERAVWGLGGCRCESISCQLGKQSLQLEHAMSPIRILLSAPTSRDMGCYQCYPIADRPSFATMHQRQETRSQSTPRCSFIVLATRRHGVQHFCWTRRVRGRHVGMLRRQTRSKACVLFRPGRPKRARKGFARTGSLRSLKGTTTHRNEPRGRLYRVVPGASIGIPHTSHPDPPLHFYPISQPTPQINLTKTHITSKTKQPHQNPKHKPKHSASTNSTQSPKAKKNPNNRPYPIPHNTQYQKPIKKTNPKTTS